MICHARIILPRTIHLSKRLVISSNPIGGIDCVANQIIGDSRMREFFRSTWPETLKSRVGLVGWMMSFCLPGW
jgi:hypothetical protein